LDVTDEENRKSVINKVLRESGRIDVLVNNAGVLCPGKPAQHPGREIRLIFE
jgi:NADP-dependent 3-hydroxy acid dehydrogenase YdfG